MVEVTLCVLMIFGIIDYFNYSDHAILAKRQSYQSPVSTALPQGLSFANEEVRISNLFAEDTLPRLLQYGLVKRYELTPGRTTLFVNGRMWKHRSGFFKNCLMREILIHNKVNGFSSETHIIDNRSSKLVARISPSHKITLYD